MAFLVMDEMDIDFDQANPFLLSSGPQVGDPTEGVRLYDRLVIIEPADLETSMSVERDVVDEAALRQSWSYGLSRLASKRPIETRLETCVVDPEAWTIWGTDCCFVCWWMTRATKSLNVIPDHNDAQLNS